MKYTVNFKNKSNGSTGRGSPISYKNAEAAVKLGNELYPNLEHWIEPVKTLELVK